MRSSYIAFSVINLFLLAQLNLAQAKSSLDLLDLPAKQSSLASKSVLMAMIPMNNTILAVGERGHIISWKDNADWQQQSPVSVSITNVTLLSDGSKIAVGHDGVILKTENNSSTWRKVFTGAELTKLKIAQLKKQHAALKLVINATQDEDELEELTYQLEDLAFALEDNQIELESGPNKPLLSVTRTASDLLFATGAYGTLLTSNDKGETWTLISKRLDNPDKFHLNSIITTSNDHLYIVGENGMGFQSTNQGKTWSSMALPYYGSLFGIIAHAEKSKQLVAFGLQGNLMVSLDGGENWQHKKLPTSASLLGGDFSPQGKAYLVGHGGIIVDFMPENLASLHINKHPSGAALSSVLVQKNSLILAGQFGISSWLLKQ
ncbi:WD40/YVTN/BNR-like repeat-containing protein [Cognaticolwellia beringensis]|uniref:Sialidase n=1 Tax=Cognaticolwellia beringensis TaxID=1967665 RepID=A0A222G988_9GAMM|nr:YCF48-related protein [Cognaticolwellia beringensis]ASP48449.1 sialidase [Cognaticolwellia beringensis]